MGDEICVGRLERSGVMMSGTSDVGIAAGIVIDGPSDTAIVGNEIGNVGASTEEEIAGGAGIEASGGRTVVACGTPAVFTIICAVTTTSAASLEPRETDVAMSTAEGRLWSMEVARVASRPRGTWATCSCRVASTALPSNVWIRFPSIFSSSEARIGGSPGRYQLGW